MIKMKTKININAATDMRTKEAFDFLQVHQLELTVSQVELIKSLKKQFKERGLSEKQTQCLFDIVKYLKPAETLTIRKNY
jgi:hypothetical protein